MNTTYSADFLDSLRKHLRDAIALREEIELSDAFCELERARELKAVDREIARFEKRIDAWVKDDRKYGEVIR